MCWHTVQPGLRVKSPVLSSTWMDEFRFPLYKSFGNITYLLPTFILANPKIILLTSLVRFKCLLCRHMHLIAGIWVNERKKRQTLYHSDETSTHRLRWATTLPGRTKCQPLVDSSQYFTVCISFVHAVRLKILYIYFHVQYYKFHVNPPFCCRR